ncbi:MAG: transcription-repair coupling factor [Nitrospirales bacterium]|nr:transcription-repair coupling factor [Nitrospirales bacterium]
MSALKNLLENLASRVLKSLEAADSQRLYNASIPHLALLLCFLRKPFLVLENSEIAATQLYGDALFFSRLINSPDIRHFPPPEDPTGIGERVRIMKELEQNSMLSVVTSKDAYKTGLALSSIGSSVLSLAKGQELGRDRLDQWLSGHGYKSVSVVVERGEYSNRGWIFDVYPVTVNDPLRLEFFGDEIDLIRSFDIETQRSIRELQVAELLSASEGNPERNILDDLCGNGERICFIHEEMAGEIRKDHDHPVISISHLPFIGEGTDAAGMSFKGLGIIPEERKGIEDLPRALARTGQQVLAVMSSEAQAERLKEILFDGGIVAPVLRDHELKDYDGRFCITTGDLSSGLFLEGLLILTEKEVFGERPSHRSIKKSKVSRLLFSIDDLKPGDFVVHKDHGIGQFVGLKRQTSDGHEEDLITLEYAGGDRLYIPFQSVDRLQKYSAAEGQATAMDRLGSKKWQQAKQKARKGIKEMADKLLKLYAERKVARGFVFSNETAMHREFDDFFHYDATPDQIMATEEITGHMRSDTPMDMLLCGDVGYGKTEVAMRAAFRAVYDGKQVAVLVPTTLLAEQHYRNFSTRFSGFPVRIDQLSRFRTREEIREAVKAAAKGETDILIGTHMLLKKDVSFHDLGLLIIDEEHKFGVAQKERLKELKKGVDVLTLTATPIPRTLQISISGIREMCTIETPPEERLAVRSIVAPFSESVIREALKREFDRGGQAFFVHNRIRDIEKIAALIRKTIPDARFAIAHGQMEEKELERIMLQFLNRELDLLLSTAIISSGLDITTANTIIIDRADTFGISDLYQLRGRVGRGNVQAYAYFLIPGEEIITGDAKKRLQAIQEMSYLGAGFRLALKDLEIRGAGNLLGGEQSGHIHRIGFDMYMEMLENAVAELKGEVLTEEIEPRIRLRLSAFVPEEYIKDVTIRLSIYKRLSSAKSLEILSDLRDEMRDRFGPLPQEVENLLTVMRLKALARSLFIAKVADEGRRYIFSFIARDDGVIVPEGFFDRLLTVLFELQKEAQGIRFLPDGFEVAIKAGSAEASAGKAEEILSLIYKKLFP